MNKTVSILLNVLLYAAMILSVAVMVWANTLSYINYPINEHIPFINKEYKHVGK